MSLADGMCGVGVWSGPLPGDPDNNVILSAVAVPDGIEVSWTYPTINPYAVAHTLLYRGTDAIFANAVYQRVVSGSSHYDILDPVAATQYYYWIEIVSVYGTVGAVIGPASAVAAPIYVHVLDDLVGRLTEAQLTSPLAGKITNIGVIEGNLALEIQNRIADTGALAGALAAVQTQSGELTTYVLNETTERTTADSAQVTQINALAVGQSDNAAAIVNEAAVRLGNDTAIAYDLSILTAEVHDVNTGLATKASIGYVDTAEADAISAAATASQLLVSAIRIGGTNLVKNSETIDGYSILANITRELITGQTLPDGSTGSIIRLTTAGIPGSIRILNCIRGNDTYSYSLYQKLVSGVGTFSVDVCDNTAQTFTPTVDWQRVIAEGVVVANYSLGIYNFIDVNLPANMVLDIWHFNVEAGNKAGTWSPAPEDLSAAIQVEASTRATQTGELYAQYTVKVDVNGYVSGYGLASTLNNGTPTSEFAIIADQFSIVGTANTNDTDADGSPFFYRTTSTVINGVTIQPGAYMKSAFIHSLSADKITAGAIGVAQHIQSTNYIPGVSGWRIYGDGTADFTTGTITGLTVQTATTGQRIKMDSSGLLFLTGDTPGGKYGSFKYGGAKYGSGVLVFFNNKDLKVPFYVQQEQTVADIHLYNRLTAPSGVAEVGDLAVVNGVLKICTTNGTPGTWVSVGSQT